MRKLAPAALAFLLASIALAGAREVRVFQVRFRSALDAANLIEPLLSSDGSVTLQSGKSMLTVQDDAEVLQRVAELLANWDVPPPSFQVRVRVLLASTNPPPPGPAAPLIEGVGAEISKLFHYTSYEEVDSLRITAAEGSSVEAAVGGLYYLRFQLRAASADAERVQLGQLELLRRERGKEEDIEVLHPLLRTTVSMRLGQTTILGAARSEGANQALIVVLWAEREAGS